MTRINILLPCPGPPSGAYWGDFHFGNSLKKALEDCGATVRIVYRPRWPWLDRFSLRRGVDLAIRGPQKYPRRIWPWAKLYIWLISREDLTPTETAGTSHIFAASPALAARLVGQGLRASVLLQCTDRDLFDPARARPDLQTDVLFVGSWRLNFHRPIVHQAIEAGYRPQVWGTKWKASRLAPEYLAGTFVPNDDLGAYYASAKVVLNDHLPQMLDAEIISNRVYDVLASGTEVVSDALPDLGRDLPGATLARDTAEVGAAIADALANHEQRRNARLQLAAHIRTNHSFHQRAHAILAVIAGKSA